MIVIKNKIHIEQQPFVYWVRIDVLLDNKTEPTFVFAGISGEELNKFCKLECGGVLTDEQINNWIESISKKWIALGPKILKNKIHYDSCGNNDILDFLKSSAK